MGGLGLVDGMFLFVSYVFILEDAALVIAEPYSQ